MSTIVASFVEGQSFINSEGFAPGCFYRKLKVTYLWEETFESLATRFARQILALYTSVGLALVHVQPIYVRVYVPSVPRSSLIH